jgi:hypothetical protein
LKFAGTQVNLELSVPDDFKQPVKLAGQLASHLGDLEPDLLSPPGQGGRRQTRSEAALDIRSEDVVLGERFADRYGRRLVFVSGVFLFAAASLACGLANSSGLLVASRAIQGLGAAFMSPAALSFWLVISPGWAITLLLTRTREQPADAR